MNSPVQTSGLGTPKLWLLVAFGCVALREVLEAWSEHLDAQVWLARQTLTGRWAHVSPLLGLAGAAVLLATAAQCATLGTNGARWRMATCALLGGTVGLLTLAQAIGVRVL